MGDFQPLGEYAQLRTWAGAALPWGPEGQWSATFGAGVVDRLVDLIDDFPRIVDDQFPGKAEAVPQALGRVPQGLREPMRDRLAR
jgi:hypothetical protein